MLPDGAGADITPIAAKQPRDMKKPSKTSRAFLLKLELRSHPTLLCVIRGALEPLVERLGFFAEHSREIIRAVDVQFAFEDLLIGATALHLGYEIATLNIRDFQRIPGLSVIQL